MKTLFPLLALIASTVLSVMLANSIHQYGSKGHGLRSGLKKKDESGKKIPHFIAVCSRFFNLIAVCLVFINVLMFSIFFAFLELGTCQCYIWYPNTIDNYCKCDRNGNGFYPFKQPGLQVVCRCHCCQLDCRHGPVNCGEYT